MMYVVKLMLAQSGVFRVADGLCMDGGQTKDPQPGQMVNQDPKLANVSLLPVSGAKIGEQNWWTKQPAQHESLPVTTSVPYNLSFDPETVFGSDDSTSPSGSPYPEFNTCVPFDTAFDSDETKGPDETIVPQNNNSAVHSGTQIPEGPGDTIRFDNAGGLLPVGPEVSLSGVFGISEDLTSQNAFPEFQGLSQEPPSYFGLFGDGALYSDETKSKHEAALQQIPANTEYLHVSSSESPSISPNALQASRKRKLGPDHSKVASKKTRDNSVSRFEKLLNDVEEKF